MFIIEFVDLWRKWGLYFRIRAQHATESHHLSFHVIEVNLCFCFFIIWTLFSLLYFASVVLFSFPKRNNLLIGFVDPDKPLLIFFMLLNMMSMDFDFVRMHLESKLPVLLPQLQIRAIFLKVQNLIAIVKFYHNAKIVKSSPLLL